jgi:cupin 2 domain-containing protein
MARRNDIPPENLFTLPPELPAEEVFTTLFATQQVRIERIISHGQTTPPGEWYDQPQDEWVMVLQGEGHLSYDNGHRVVLKAGDSVLLTAHTRHRVDFTSHDPVCIWLAIHCF